MEQEAEIKNPSLEAKNIKEEVKTFVEKMGFNMLHAPEVKKEDNRLSITLFIDEPRSLIGERGVNLHALQLLLRLINLKKYDPEVKLDIDINGYKQKRAEFLREMALGNRRRALEEKRIIELEPMTAFDRRIIHTTLSEFGDVKTESAGETPYRRVIISLIKN